MVSQVLCMLIYLKAPQSQPQAQAVMEESLATAMHAACCCSIEALSGASLGAVVFGQDMLLNLPFQADILILLQN